MSKKRKNGKRSGNWVTKTERLARYLRDGFMCQYCGKDLHGADARHITLDHLKCRNGKMTVAETKALDVPENTVTACISCNSRRQNKRWTQYATGGAIERIRRTVRRSMKKYRKAAADHIAGRANLKAEVA
jgi:5-methylcytosine-specific restriction endonuclease McrA